MYGFCDPNVLSSLTPTEDEEVRSDYLARVFACNDAKNKNQLFMAPYHETVHWMLAVISPWNGTVFWLDPAGAGIEVRQHAKKIIHEGLLKFSLLHRTGIKKLKKNLEVKWRYPRCPRQALGTNDYGYHICRYMLEIIENRQQVIPDQYIRGIKQTYSQANIDQI